MSVRNRGALLALPAVAVLVIASIVVAQRSTGSDRDDRLVTEAATAVTPAVVSTPETTASPTAIAAVTATAAPTPTATPVATVGAVVTPAPEPMSKPTPEPTPEPVPERTPEPTPQPTPAPERTPEATPEPTPTVTPVDRSWAPAGSLEGLTDEEVTVLREWYEDGRWEWDVLHRLWYPLSYIDADGEVQVWAPPFPGAPRRLTDVEFFFASAASSLDSEWVAHIGLALPPAFARFTLTDPFRPGAAYGDDEIGFYPPLKPGVNIVWAAGVDMTDLSLRPECPVIARLEVLATGWVWPTAEIARDEFISSYEEYLTQINHGYPPSSGRWDPTPVDTGRGMVWSEEHHAAFFRATESTPYGWYTFDIETMSMRPVDTSPGSWDTINLWGDVDKGEYPYTLNTGVLYYNQIHGATLPPGIEPWPPFDPWREVVRSGAAATVPGPLLTRSDRYFEPTPRNRWGISEYMRITCE